MRKFKFIGNPKDYVLKYVYGNVYDGNQRAYQKSWGTIIDCSIKYPKDWEEVLDNNTTVTNHKDTDLGYYTQYFISLNPEKTSASDIDIAITKAKYLIKQLKKKTTL